MKQVVRKARNKPPHAFWLQLIDISGNSVTYALMLHGAVGETATWPIGNVHDAGDIAVAIALKKCGMEIIIGAEIEPIMRALRLAGHAPLWRTVDSSFGDYGVWISWATTVDGWMSQMSHSTANITRTMFKEEKRDAEAR